MTKDRYVSLKIDSDFFLIIDSESEGKLSVASCRTEQDATLVVNSLNRCNVLDKTQWDKK